MGEEGNVHAIEKELENIQKLRSNREYREFWNQVREMPGMFKQLRLPREERERLWSEYSDICESAKREVKEHKEKEKDNASKLEKALQGLTYDHTYEKPLDESLLDLLINPLPALFPEKRYRYHEFWLHAKEISEMFKSLRLSRDDRERLWSGYSGLCENVKRMQNEIRAESEKRRGTFQSLIQDAYNQAGGASNREELDKARAMQTENLKLMKESELVGKDRGPLWKFWKMTNDKIHSRREEVQESNFLNAGREMSSIYNTAEHGDPYAAINEIKEIHKTLPGLYVNRGQKNELYTTLNNAWESATKRVGEIKEKKKINYEEWRERTEGHIERWERNKEKTEDFISRLENQIYRLEGEEGDARTSEYASKVRGWIEEKEEKIESGRNYLLELEEKLYSAREKLSG